MQGVVQALITSPQLDTIPFRERHIQAVICPLLVLVCYGESAVGNGGHIAEHKGQGEQIPNRLAGFVRRDAASPRRPQEGTDHLRGFDDNTTVDHQARYGVSNREIKKLYIFCLVYRIPHIILTMSAHAAATARQVGELISRA